MTKDFRIGFHKEAIRAVFEKLGAESLYNDELEKIIAFRVALSDETDRGCVLMAASFLEDRLSQLLKAYLVKDKKVTEKLFAGSGPLGTFSTKIDMAYLLSLIPKAMHRDLHLLRKIRNEFAHNPSEISLNTQKLSNMCSDLNYAGKKRAELSSRECFINAMLGMDGTIYFNMQDIKNLKPLQEEDFDERESMLQLLQNTFHEKFKI